MVTDILSVVLKVRCEIGVKRAIVGAAKRADLRRKDILLYTTGVGVLLPGWT